MIVFTIITVLAHREKLHKKRNRELKPASVLLDVSANGTGGADEKNLPLGDEEDATSVLKR